MWDYFKRYLLRNKKNSEKFLNVLFIPSVARRRLGRGFLIQCDGHLIESAGNQF